MGPDRFIYHPPGVLNKSKLFTSGLWHALLACHGLENRPSGVVGE